MGAVKKVVKGITGIDLDAKKKAEEEARRQQQESEDAARKQAALESATNVGQQGEAQAETPEATTTSDVKKRIKGGRKSLTVSRAGGSGINI